MSSDSTRNSIGQHAHFDCFGGATTSAILAACLDANEDLVREIETNIQQGLGDFKLECISISKTRAAGMAASAVNVVLEQDDASCKCAPSDEILDILNAVDCQFISTNVREKAKTIISELVVADNVVHGRADEQPIDLSLYEMMDIVAILLALEKLGVTTISCSPLPLGEGSILTDKGSLLPIPSPMTLQLVIGMHTCPGPPVISERDLTTPTAAALLKVLTNVSSGITKRPMCFMTQTIGVGVDEKDAEPRVLRLLLGVNDSNADTDKASFPMTVSLKKTSSDSNVPHTTSAPWNMDQLTQLETNLDDMTAEALAFAVQLLLDNGAVDAWVAPIVMKKGRAAHTLYCLCHSDESIVNTLLELMFRHTTTLGIRIHKNVHRAALRRSFVTITTPFHDSSVKVKVGYLGEEVVSIKAEFDDCAMISRETGVPIKQVAEEATRAAQEQLSDKNYESSK